MQKILDFIKNKIDGSSHIQPILFLWNNKDKINLELSNIISSLFSYYQVDKNNIFKIEDDWDAIKIETLRSFISKSTMKSSFKFQIFLIENISRFTQQSANACLKFLEEPWSWNVIFLTNYSESWVIDTILSRVFTVNVFWSEAVKKNDFYYKMIDDFLNKRNVDLISYFFDDKKLEKSNYMSFFYTFLHYIKENLVFIDLLEQIENNINLIEKNNVSPKYLFDSLIIKIM